MKKILLILSGGFLLMSVSKGQNLPDEPKEKLNYVIHYGVINGGIASLELLSDTLGGKVVLHSAFHAQTTGLTDAFFKVRDIYECYINTETLLPVKSIRNIHEGRYRRYNIVLFDHETRSDSVILMSDLSGKHIAQKGIHDILSCFHYFRKIIMPQNPPLNRGDLITVVTWFTDELYPIRLRYAGIDEIRTKVGRIKCYKFNPVTEVGRLFKDEESATFWFSADKNYIPVRIRFDIFVGSFSVDLTSYEGLSSPLEIKVK
jgi:hypothetical protein